MGDHSKNIMLKLKMCHAFILILLISLKQCFGMNFEVSTALQFDSEAISFYSVTTSSSLGLHNKNSVFQCMVGCDKLVGCRSFFRSVRGACVFGMTQYVDELEESGLVVVAPQQAIYVKGV